MNIPFPSEDEFRAETVRRHELCWAYLKDDGQIRRLMSDAIPRAMEAFAKAKNALEGPRERPRTPVESAMYRAYVDPLVTAETDLSLRLWNLFEQMYQTGRSDERESIRAAIRADVREKLGPTVDALVEEAIIDEYERDQP